MPACLVAFGINLLLLFSQAIATPAPSVDVAKSENPQVAGEAMLERAEQLSDIRRPGDPSFHLKVNFSFVGNELKTFHGTYDEWWISDSKWRREIEIGNQRRIEIARDSKFFEVESEPPLPEKARRVEFATSIFPARTSKLQFESIVDLVPGDPSAKCAVTAPLGMRRVRHAFCFDAKNGVLVEKVAPDLIRERLTDFSCHYGSFAQFGTQWFPNDMECLQSGHHQMDVNVVELTVVDATGLASSMNPPPGAIELGRCMTGAVPPTADSTPPPVRPAGLREVNPSVMVRMVVDTKGNPEDVKVIGSRGKPLDDKAVGAVQRWHFKPAMCNGEPIASQIDYAVSFRTY